ncbi:hypothetical protein BCR39DRAFT_597802 [Naematelia encephala]|uniref:FHA domain-containing protein n=1 Tax=Naematelia encephala TaxID=71784 RepID=A0A1Y2BCU8_9TREE|nr:hypothetical protein BCR39DRAFT_597802 [Naematelia encephala]
MGDREDSPFEVTPSMGTLGTLTLCARKSGVDLQAFPIDAERITIGSDWDSDIRLYFPDVSKLHVEIILSNKIGDQSATMTVHGSAGVYFSPHGGSTVHCGPSTTVNLKSRDSFTIRKKMFRFQFCDLPTRQSAETIESPVVKTESLPTAPPLVGDTARATISSGEKVGRRNSHRLSLVPTGKTFTPYSPAKSRRHSTIGISQRSDGLVESSPTHVTQSIEEEEEENQDANASLVDVVEGEGGDTVYLEVKEDTSAKPIYERGFMTPQQRRKLAPRNTSAVPRTRQLPPTMGARAELQSQEPSAQTGPNEALPVPSPSSGSPAPRVTATVALSTPRGPASLRKSLLLRSARKVWETNRSPGVEGAIESGAVQVRRKSLSPRIGKGRKSSSPAQDTISEDEADEDTAQQNEPKQFEWVYEDGQEAVAVESDESMDSLEADVSLDVPEQILSFGDVQQAEAEEDEDMMEPTETVLDNVEAAYDAPSVAVTTELEGNDYQDEQEDLVGDDMLLPGTPAARRALDRFYTPQARRAGTGPRQSLSSIGKPASRFGRPSPGPSVPATTPRPQRTPGRLGKPSRGVKTPAPVEVDAQESLHTPTKKEKLQPGLAMIAEAIRRRQSLATPRALPLPPASFKDPVRDGFSLATPSHTHPALNVASPEVDTETRVIPSTPLNDVKARLAHFRRQSVQRAERRTTIGLQPPSTPAERPTINQSSSFTNVNPTRHWMAPPPETPVMQPIGGVSEVSSLETTPLAQLWTRPTVNLNDVLPQEHDESIEEGSSDVSSSEKENDVVPTQVRVPPTPSFVGLRTMLREPVQPKTPSFAGLREMFPPTPAVQPTPNLAGVKQLFAARTVPATPSFVGVRKMFTMPKEQVGTPALEGLDEMFGKEEWEEEEEQEEIEVREDDDNDLPVAAPKRSAPSRSKVAKKDTSSAPSRSRRAPTKVAVEQKKEIAASKEIEETTSVPSRSKTRRTTTEEPEVSVEPKPRSTSTRTKRTATAEAEVVVKPTRGSRSTRAQPKATTPVRPEEDDEEEEQEEFENRAPIKGRKVVVIQLPKSGKKALEETSDQFPQEEQVEKEKEKEKKSGHGHGHGRTTKSSTSTSATSRGKKSEEKEKTSAPSRSKRTTTTTTTTVGDKENKPEEPITKSRSKAKVDTAATTTGAGAGVGTRATRSRK